jgi:hypothetical protein
MNEQHVWYVMYSQSNWLVTILQWPVLYHFFRTPKMWCCIMVRQCCNFHEYLLSDLLPDQPLGTLNTDQLPDQPLGTLNTDKFVISWSFFIDYIGCTWIQWQTYSFFSVHIRALWSNHASAFYLTSKP